MSLNYDLTKIKDRQEVTTVIEDGERVMNPVTTNIIFGCMSTYIGEITEANHEEWFARYHIWNQTHGYDDNVTLGDVKRHIGLHTNVFPKKPMSQWFKEHIWRDTLYDIRHGIERNINAD